MVYSYETNCVCGGELYYYDEVKRGVKTKNSEKYYIYVKRYRCEKCGKVHRKIPGGLFPYKHYEKEIIIGVIEGSINSETLGYEDYPCELTMKLWKEQIKKKQT